MNFNQAILILLAILGPFLILSAYSQMRRNGNLVNKFIIFKFVTGLLLFVFNISLILIWTLSLFGGNYICDSRAPKSPLFHYIWNQSFIRMSCHNLGLYIPPQGLDYRMIDQVKTREIQPLYAVDFLDDKVLMGASHNVLIVQIIEQIGVSDNPNLQTHFKANALDNIKGGLQNEVIITQEGGYKNGVLYVLSDDFLHIRGDSYLLKPGNTYLLATRYSFKNDWYTLNPHPNARKTISTNPNLSKSQLQDLARNDPKVQALQEAYKNEILLDADVYHNNTRNSYKSLYPDQTPQE